MFPLTTLAPIYQEKVANLGTALRELYVSETIKNKTRQAPVNTNDLKQCFKTPRSPRSWGRRKLNILHAVIFFWLGNVFLWFNNLLQHPSYHLHFPQDTITHCTGPPQENGTPKMMQSVRKCHSSQILKREEGNPIRQKSRDCGSSRYGTTAFTGSAGSSVLEASEIEFFLPYSYE